jgi:hypothetical protein
MQQEITMRRTRIRGAAAEGAAWLPALSVCRGSSPLVAMLSPWGHSTSWATAVTGGGW